MFKTASKIFKSHRNVPERQEAASNDAELPSIYNELFFYGRITRQEAEDILKVNGCDNGSYLLRESITPMGNFNISLVHEGNVVHYAIQKQVDGRYQIAEGNTFKDPKALIDHYKGTKQGFITIPRNPCLRTPTQEAVAFRGLSYRDLHAEMGAMAKKMNANLDKAFGPMRDQLLLNVLHSYHLRMPWFHGEITREEGNRRLEGEGHREGLFLIRARSNSASYALTVSCENVLRHYVITVSDGETYSIETGHRFKALIILVDHYHNKRDGLPCRLSEPVPSPDTTIVELKNYKSLVKRLTNQAGYQLPPDPRRPPPPLPVDDVNAPPLSDAPPVPMRPGQGHVNGAAGGAASFSQDNPSPNTPTGTKDFNYGEEEPMEEPRDTHNEALCRALSEVEAQEQEQIYSDIREDVISGGVTAGDVDLDDVLGSGQFGEVWKGSCLLKGKRVPVAVKMLKSDNPQGEEEIMKEADLMKTLDHQHIVRFIGFCKGRNLMLVLELAECGPLKSFLRKHQKNQDMKQWHQMELALQVCEGMMYLSSQGVVHRDLAARNVLLLNHHFAKISDFGLSRTLDNEYYTAGAPGKWPLMWYAPECIYYHKFTSKSDVWSFGVLLYEIMAYGSRPYKGMNPTQISIFLENENRMSKPQRCDAAVYNVMLECWEWNKDFRLSFDDLYPKMKDLYVKFKKKKI